MNFTNPSFGITRTGVPKTGGKCDGKYRVHKPSECKGRAHVFSPDKKWKPAEQDSDQKN
jgi:hypothetical protein